MEQSSFNTGKLKEKYKALFNAEPLLVRSPGRVNIIGEHTDYNEGFVLPAAIDKAIFIAIGKREDNVISLYAQDYQQSHEVDLSGFSPTEKHWPNYILGMVDQLQKRGYKLG